MTLEELTTLRPREAMEIVALVQDPADQRSALRFVLRGLTVEKAIAKIGQDNEMVQKIRDDRRSKKELQERLNLSSEEIDEMKRYITRNPGRTNT